MKIKILNTKEDAIMSKTDSEWINPQNRLYDRIIAAENAIETLREVYLIVPDDISAQSNYPPYEKNGCKYPHHVLNENGDLVLSEDGIRAAYRRIYFVMGINITEEIRAHIVRHYKELGIYTGSDFQIAADIKKNFNDTVNYSVDTLKEEIKKAMDSGYKPPEQPYCQLREYFITEPGVFYKARTGIELIHPYWIFSEVTDMWNNWLLMTDEMKKLSDEHSYQLFGKDNAAHYNELLRTHYDEEVSSLSKQIKHYQAKILYYS